MNWFERYGIVGMFFIVMTGMWFFCLFPEARGLLFSKSYPELPKYIGGFCGLSFLPFGYIIMVCSQAWYYSRRNKRDHISGKLWTDDLLKEQKKKILEEEKNFVFDETDKARLEAVLAYYDRKYFSPKTPNLISSFTSKRFDVIAINHGLIWAIILSLIAATCIALVILDNIFKWFKPLTLTTWFVITLAVLIVRVLYLSGRIQEGQVFEVGKRKFRDMELEKKKDSD